jgi:hypothetical protein
MGKEIPCEHNIKRSWSSNVDFRRSIFQNKENYQELRRPLHDKKVLQEDITILIEYVLPKTIKIYEVKNGKN